MPEVLAAAPATEMTRPTTMAPSDNSSVVAAPASKWSNEANTGAKSKSYTRSPVWQSCLPASRPLSTATLDRFRSYPTKASTAPAADAQRPAPSDQDFQIGREHVCTPVTNAQIVCCL